MRELYPPQASSPVTSRAHQTYSAVTGVKGYGSDIDSPGNHIVWCV